MQTLAGCTIAFDLDGTLVDTAPDLHRALNHVLAAERLPPATLEDVRAFVGHGHRALIVRASAVHGIHHLEPKLDDLTEEYVRIYAADISARSQLFPGVATTLKTFAAAGATLCVCTNKRTDLSNQLLAAMNLAPYFAAVIGADSVRNRKPHPDHFITAIRAAKGDPARAMMIGDSAADVGSARAASAPVVVYAHGYTDTAPELLGADAVFGHFNELPDLAFRLLGPQPTPRA
jgi:phosphoglycolate phosphatase